MNSGRFVNLFFGRAILLLTFGASVEAQGILDFPEVKPQRLFMVVRDGKDASREITIRTKRNKPAYVLDVFATSIDGETIQSIGTELYGVGDQLTRLDTKYEPNLLNPDKWGHGEIEFLPRDFGSQENRSSARYMVFRLRRMKIEITVSDVKLNDSSTGIVEAKIAVTVKPNRSKRSRPADVTRPI